MVADSEHFDELPDELPGERSGEAEDAQLEHLLKSAFAAPELSPEFAKSLGRELDLRFAEHVQLKGKLQAEEPTQDVAGYAASRNGSVRAVEISPEDSASASLTPAKPRTKYRLVATLAAAASLLVAALIWNSPPAYGWAAMMRALEQCDWVQAVTADGGASGWISSKQGIVASQTKGRAIFRDDRRHVQSSYLAGEPAVSLEKTATGNAPDWETRLLGLLMQEMTETHSFFDASSLGFELIDESWRSIENEAGTGDLIELRVMLRQIGGEGHEFELVFLLEPETQLPVSCRLSDAGSSEAATYNFTYPEQGPTTIFSLDVPSGTPVIDSRAPQAILAEKSLSEKATVAGVEKSEVENEPAATVSAKQKPAGDADPRAESPHAQAPLAGPLSDERLVGWLNQQLADYWQAQGIRSAEPATDAEFLRRVYLDLTGRIPRVSEVYQFLEDPSEDRRVLLVDHLLASRDHATHLAAIWRTMLLPEGVDVRQLGGTAKFDEWLADRFGENLPYDQLVSQLLLAEGRVQESGPLLFYATLKLNPEEIAAKTSRVFLGTRLECAQCHDHPFDEKISQLDFWGFAAFFAQISRPLGKMETASPVLRVRDNRHGEVRLPESEEVVPPKLPDSDQRASERGDSAPASSVAGGGADGEQLEPSRRRQLVQWLVSHDNAQFSRAAVNRVWELLFGRGIIDPVDDMRSDFEPAVPGILDPLARDFAASGFDLRRLLRALVLSDAYQLSSRGETDDPAQTLCFARMNIKSLTASQLYDCIAVATRREEVPENPTLEGAVRRINNSTREAFIAQFRAPPGQRTDYQAGIPQALTLMHGQLIHQATDLASSGLLKSLAAPFFSDEQRVETLFLSTLSRLPESAERQEMTEYVAAVDNEETRQQALGDVLWALLNSAEFTLNH